MVFVLKALLLREKEESFVVLQGNERGVEIVREGIDVNVAVIEFTTAITSSSTSSSSSSSGYYFWICEPFSSCFGGLSNYFPIFLYIINFLFCWAGQKAHTAHELCSFL